MNPVSIVIGAAAVLYGAYTAYNRKKDPSKFGKLEAMKKQFGEGKGTLIHVIAYTVIPIGVGLCFIVAGLLGISIF